VLVGKQKISADASLKTQNAASSAEESLQSQKQAQIMLEGPPIRGFKSDNYTHVEYRLYGTPAQLPAIRGFIGRLQGMCGGVSVLVAENPGTYHLLGSSKVLENEIAKARMCFDFTMVQTDRFIANAFEIGLSRDEISLLAPMYRAFKKIASSWSVLVEKDSPDWTEKGWFRLRIYGEEPVTALGIVNAKLNSPIWESMTHYLLVARGAKLALSKLAKQHNLTICYFTSRDSALNVVLTGKLIDVINVVQSFKSF